MMFTQQKLNHQFELIDFRDSKGEYPQLKRQRKIKMPNATVYELIFKSCIPLVKWQANKEFLSSTLECHILNITALSDARICMEVVSGYTQIPEFIEWDDKFLGKSNEVILGKALLDDVVINLDQFPHYLITGIGGMGKSNLIQCMVWQCVQHNAKVYIADCKGGVEWVRWSKMGLINLATDEDDIFTTIEAVFNEWQQRIALFQSQNIKSFWKYNTSYESVPLQRIILVIDEVREIYDTEGLSGEDAKRHEEMRRKLDMLVRCASRVGINIFIGARIFDDSYRAVLENTNKISGMLYSEEMSEAIIGTNSLVHLDPIPGRMIYFDSHKEREFQSYYFDEDKWLKPSTSIERLNEMRFCEFKSDI